MNARPRNPDLLRILGWIAYPVLLAASQVLRSADAPAAVQLRLGDGLLYLLPIALTMVGALLLGARTDHEERRVWLLIAAISVLIFLSEFYFTWYTTTVSSRGPQMPDLYQVLQLCAVVLGIGVMLALTSFGSASTQSVTRFAVDVLAGMVVVAAGLYGFWILPMFLSAEGQTWAGAAVSTLYPVVGLTIVAFMSVTAAVGRSYRWHSWELLITASFLLYGAGLIISPIAYIRLKTVPDPSASFWATAALGFGYYVLFMAIVYRATSRSGHTGVEPWFFPRLGPSWFPTVYPVLLAAALSVMGVSALRIGDNPEGIPITLAAVALAALLIVRSWLKTDETVLHRRLATTDPVTGVFNYRILRERLGRDLEFAQAADSALAVISIGIEGLHAISEARGSAGADALMSAVAANIAREAPGDTTLSRMADDVFVLVAPGISGPEALEVAERLLSALAGYARSAGVPAHFSAGIAEYPAHGRGADELVSLSAAAQEVASLRDDMAAVVYDKSITAEPGPVSELSPPRERARRATTRALAAAVDARDPDTRRHSENVADLASALALMIDLQPERAHVLDLAAQLHDIGKIGIPDALLRARGELSSAQREQFKQHVILGEHILASAKLDEVLPAVRHHHERWDGTGYPDGLSGSDIPLEARILSLCDAYESMTTSDSYARNISAADAITQIERGSGTQFDPDIAGPFCRMIRQLHVTSTQGSRGAR